MLDQSKIADLYKKSAELGWTYPQVFDALKSIGVERYEVNVPKHEIRYVGGGTSFMMAPPKEFVPLTAAKQFDLAGLKKALARVQARESNYEQFLSEIAAAGVAFYRVDMQPRTVTYHGSTPKDKLVEKVPA